MQQANSKKESSPKPQKAPRVQKAPQDHVPWEARWLDVRGVAQLTGYSVPYLRDVIALRKGFPQACGEKGHKKRWKAGEVDAWMRSRMKGSDKAAKNIEPGAGATQQ